MLESFKYSFKVWLTTVVLPPTVIVIINYANDPTEYGMMGFFVIMLVYGLVFSFFSWLAFLIGVYYILKCHITPVRKKIILQCLALPLVVLAFAFLAAEIDTLFAFYDRSFLLILAYYTICLLASIYIYKLPEPYTNHQQNPIT